LEFSPHTAVMTARACLTHCGSSRTTPRRSVRRCWRPLLRGGVHSGRRPAPAPLDYHAVFAQLDKVDIAKSDINGTIALLSLVIDVCRDDEDGVLDTLERHLLTDLAALNASFESARTAILSPLRAIACPNSPPMGTEHTLAETDGEGLDH